ncbi:uncharacterized protein LOC123516041 isoform X2 [Portunus trituberculatus]|uniref:uncharacterized protein LOC123516041 isoform X2 n=1 Tax=Portunus trituberculatus TaxID=210409 RepID=UPI001E1CF8CD|nr:uncharacterized protein LOC123516041 isoform X2 [Portunus trituberculatus]
MQRYIRGSMPCQYHFTKTSTAMRRIAGVLLCLVAAVAVDAAEAMKEAAHHEVSDIRSASAERNANSGVVQIGGQRLLGVSSTTTHTSVVMVTSTVFFSCLSGTSAAVCGGRRRKKSVPTMVEFDDDSDTSRASRALDGSLVDPDGTKSYASDSSDSSSDSRQVDKDGKFQFLTVWSAVSTTTTVTMLYTDTNTTIRLSYYCQAGFQQLPNGCG